MNAILIMASIVHCYVGCNTGSPDRQALHVLECDTETGAAKIVQSVKGVEGTTYFQIDKERRFLYSAIGEAKDGRKVGLIVRFPLDGWKIEEMERLCELPCEAPCHVSLTPDERRVAFAAYTSATCGSVGIDGKGLKTFVFPNDEMGPCVDRQQKAYAHQTFCVKVRGCEGEKVRGCALGVVDLGCDRIWFFDPVTMERKSCEIKFDAGDGPRHAIFSKDGNYLFVLCELGSCVYSFRRGETPRPRFERIGKWSMLPEGTDLRTSKAAAIKLTADGKILMASNRGHDSIAFYEVGDGGKLTLKNIAKLRGRFPRDFELMPGERFMVVGHKMSNEIQVYRFDRAACSLEPVGEPLTAWRPLCFKFLSEK